MHIFYSTDIHMLSLSKDISLYSLSIDISLYSLSISMYSEWSDFILPDNHPNLAIPGPHVTEPRSWERNWVTGCGFKNTLSYIPMEHL